MRLVILLLVFNFFFSTAQNKDITLEDIWVNKSFDTKGLEAFHSMRNGDFYTVLNHNRYGTYLDKYDYATLEKVETLVLAKDLPDIDRFESYTFDREEKKLLLGVALENVYRRSKVGKYYVYDLDSKKLDLVAEAPIMEPAFSPDGKKVAYVQENNLYVKNLESGDVRQITSDGQKNKVINGITDWVYEEEFYLVSAFAWNESSDKIAFFRFDETDVPEFSMDIYGTSLYPKQQNFKYPKPGENNSLVSLHMHALKSNTTQRVELGELGQHYLPRMKWTGDPNLLTVTTLNRHQNNLNLVLVDAERLSASLLLNEKDDAYLRVHDHLTFLNDNSFIWTSETDGFNHLYHYDRNGKLLQQITKGDWEVTDFYGVNEKTKRVFYQSTEEGSINRSIYSIDISGKKKEKLSKYVGTNSAAFSNSFKYFVNTYSSATTPTNYTLMDAATGKEIREIQNNLDLAEKLSAYNLPPKEFSVLSTSNGDFNMYMIKPPDFDPDKTYPLLMFQYSGPGSQSVVNRWHNAWRHDYWHMMLAQKGYVIACVDGRGTGFKGRDFKKVTYKELGKYEVEDQVEAARELGKLPYIDQDNIGIWGWSYGGYMSSLAITKGAEVFKMAIAVAPVTSWRFYDSVYTERYMQTPQENPDGYDDNSPLNHVDKLQGAYLLIHGSSDDNVHVQNSMRMVNALVEANKQFDLFIYPDRAHGILEGKNTRLHLFGKMTNFIEEQLKTNNTQPALSENLKL